MLCSRRGLCCSAAMAPPPLTPSASRGAQYVWDRRNRSSYRHRPTMRSCRVGSCKHMPRHQQRRPTSTTRSWRTSRQHSHQQYWAGWLGGGASAATLGGGGGGGGAGDDDEDDCPARPSSNWAAGWAWPRLRSALQGAQTVDATDIEQNALRYCAENAKLNGIDGDRFSTAILDWQEVAPPGGQSTTYDVVLAADCVHTDEVAPRSGSWALHVERAVVGRVLLVGHAERPTRVDDRCAAGRALRAVRETRPRGAAPELDRQFTSTGARELPDVRALRLRTPTPDARALLLAALHCRKLRRRYRYVIGESADDANQAKISSSSKSADWCAYLPFVARKKKSRPRHTTMEPP